MVNNKKGNAISKIIEDNLDYLVRVAYYRLGSRVEAEDLVYDAVLHFLEKAPDNINPKSVRLYLFRIVLNRCLDNYRSAKRNLIEIDRIDIEDDTAEILSMEDADRINTLLDSLPTREADIIRMNVIDNLSFVEISSILSIPQSTAKSRYKSGMDRLRKILTTDKMS